jgi:hypothetical protein
MGGVGEEAVEKALQQLGTYGKWQLYRHTLWSLYSQATYVFQFIGVSFYGKFQGVIFRFFCEIGTITGLLLHIELGSQYSLKAITRSL